MKTFRNINIDQILDMADLVMREIDICYIFKDDNDRADNKKIIKEFIDLVQERNAKDANVKDFFRRYKKYIDPKKLLLILINNYKEYIDSLKRNRSGKLDREEIRRNIEIIELEKDLKDLIQVGSGMEECILKYFYDSASKKYVFEVIDSNEVINNIKTDGSKNIARFQQIEQDFEDYGENGIEYLLHLVILTDYKEIFPNRDFGEKIRDMLLDDEIMRENEMTAQKIEDLKRTDLDEYFNLIDNVDFKKMLPHIREMLEKNIKYVNIDKLLSIAAYRIEEAFENEIINCNNNKNICELWKDMLIRILNNLGDREKSFVFMLVPNVTPAKRESYEDKETEEDTAAKEIKYSSSQSRVVIRKFGKDYYLTSKKIDEIRNKIDSQEINFDQIDSEQIDLIFSKEELEKRATLNDANLIFVSDRFDWNKEKILNAIYIKGNASLELIEHLIETGKIANNDLIKLYMKNLITLDLIEKVKDKIDFSNIVDAYKLGECYRNDISKDKILYARYVELYKRFCFQKDNKEKDEQKEAKQKMESMDNIMEDMLEHYSEHDLQKYIKNIIDYYHDGILNLEKIIEWNDKNIIKEIIIQLYGENSINLKQICRLITDKLLPYDFIPEIVLSDKFNHEQRMQFILSGVIVDEKIIAKLLERGLINDEDLCEIEKHNIMDVGKFRDEKFESLEGLLDLNSENKMPREPSDKVVWGKQKTRNDEITSLISADERVELFRLLNAKQMKIKVDEGHPFYGYTCLVIAGKVAILEKFFKGADGNQVEKDMKENHGDLESAYGDATYVFPLEYLRKVGDLKTRVEATSQRKYLVSRVNHTASWGTNLLYNIGYILLGEKKKGKSEEEKDNITRAILDELGKVYSFEQIDKILDQVKKINELYLDAAYKRWDEKIEELDEYQQ